MYFNKLAGKLFTKMLKWYIILFNKKGVTRAKRGIGVNPGKISPPIP